MPQPLILQTGLQVRQLLPEAQILGPSDLVVQRWVKDARQVRPGDGWVAVPKTPRNLSQQKNPTKTEGFSIQASGGFAQELALAIRGGAAAVVTDSPLYEDIPIPLILVPDVREAWARICHALAGHPSKTLRVLAVAGRVGTAATCWILKAVLAHAGYRAGLLSPLGCFDGAAWKSPEPHAHSPEAVASQLARMVQQRCTHAVLEVGPEGLANHLLAGMELDVVCLCPFGLPGARSQSAQGGSPGLPPAVRPLSSPTPIQNQSCRWLPTLERGLFRYVKLEALTLLSADDPISARCLPNLEGPVLTVGQYQTAEITARLIEAQLAEQMFLLQAGADVVPVRTRRIGKEHITSCLLAAAVGLAYGMDLSQVVRALEAVETVPGHLERIEHGQPFAVFLQLARSGAQVQLSVQTLRRLCKRRLICVAGIASHQQKRASLLRRMVGRYVDRLVLTVNEPFAAPPAPHTSASTKPILDACDPSPQTSWIPDRGEAIFTALQQAQPEDAVLILTTCPTSYSARKTEQPSWDDRAVIHACLDYLYPAAGSTD